MTLKFGVYASEKPSTIVRQFRPLLNVLEIKLAERLGEAVTIQLQVSKSYKTGARQLTDGKVDFSQFGPASYVLAKQVEPQIQLLAVEAKKGKKTFDGIIAVHQDSDITNLSQLAGRSFAFGNERSTIGRYLSQLYLYDNGLFAKNLSTYKYLGRHDRVGTAVGAGDYDAGALKESAFDKLVRKGVKLRSIARFPNITRPWIARAGLAPIIADALQSALLNLKDETADNRLLRNGFLATDDKDFKDIRKAIRCSDAFFGG